MRKWQNRAGVMVFLGLLLLASTALAAESLQVVVQKAPVRQTPQVFGRIIFNLGYGARVNVQQRKNGWLQVQAAGKSGWLHESAVARRAARLVAGNKKADVAASQQELTLAGKGFNQQVEQAYRQKNNRLDYVTIDRMESTVVDENELLQFVRAGGLGGGDYAN